MKPCRLLRITIILTTIIITYSCKKDGIVTPDDSNATPGRRDYTWVADTINNPFLNFQNIWGKDPNNLWTAGVMMSDGLYKYDGSKWSLDDRVYISDPIAVWGYENSVWIGNDQGCIWKFETNSNSYIQELTDLKIDGNVAMFSAMTGTSSNEIYTVGYKAHNPIIVKYNGKTWTVDKLLSDLGGFSQIIYTSKNDRYYIVLSLKDYSTQILEYDRKELKKIYEYPPSNGGPTVTVIDGYAYFVIGQKIYRYFNNNMEYIFEVNDPNFGGCVWGRNRNDIFTRMQDGLAHYNGTDWKYLFKVAEPARLAPRSAIFDKEVFIPVRVKRTGYSIIYHGKLK